MKNLSLVIIIVLACVLILIISIIMDYMKKRNDNLGTASNNLPCVFFSLIREIGIVFIGAVMAIVLQDASTHKMKADSLKAFLVVQRDISMSEFEKTMPMSRIFPEEEVTEYLMFLGDEIANNHIDAGERLMNNEEAIELLDPVVYYEFYYLENELNSRIKGYEYYAEQVRNGNDSQSIIDDIIYDICRMYETELKIIALIDNLSENPCVSKEKIDIPKDIYNSYYREVQGLLDGNFEFYDAKNYELDNLFTVGRIL